MTSIPILIEKQPGDGYLAKTGSPLDLQAQGATEQEAIARIHALWQQKMSTGAKLIETHLGTDPFQDLPFLDPNDPSVQEWLKIMAERRASDVDYPPLPSEAA